MEAPHSPIDKNFAELDAIARLGRSNVKEAQLVRHQNGYLIAKPSPELRDVIDTNTIKETIQQLPDFLREGKVDRAFYEDVKKGIQKLQFSHPEEKAAVQFIANQIFKRNEKQFKNAKLPSQVNPITVAQALREKQDQAKVIATARSIAIPKELTPLQKQAAAQLDRLIAPQNRDRVMAHLRNLVFIQSDQDLDAFSQYVDALVEYKNSMADQLSQGKIQNDLNQKSSEKFFGLMGNIYNLVLTKPELDDDQQQYFLGVLDSSLFEQADLKNSQLLSDIFLSATEPDPGFERRRDILQGDKLKLSEQLTRENSVFYKLKGPQIGDFNLEEKKLVQAGFHKRPTGFDVWQKSDWYFNKIVPQGPQRQIFISGTLEFSFAVAGQKPVTNSVEFNIESLGNLNLEQATQVMNFLKHSIFDKDPPKFPASLEFLQDRRVSLDGTTAKDELLKIAQEKKEELEFKLLKTYYQAVHPELSA